MMLLWVFFQPNPADSSMHNLSARSVPRGPQLLYVENYTKSGLFPFVPDSHVSSCSHVFFYCVRCGRLHSLFYILFRYTYQYCIRIIFTRIDLYESILYARFTLADPMPRLCPDDAVGGESGSTRPMHARSGRCRAITIHIGRRACALPADQESCSLWLPFARHEHV